MKEASTNLKKDDELLRLMLAGDSAAFGELYDRWQGSVYRFALRMSGSEAIAEDATQEVFLSLMRDGWQYEGRGSVASYLMAMARYRVLSHLRYERRFVAIDEEERDEQKTDERLITKIDPMADLSNEEVVGALQQAILALPVHYREVVLLCHLHEMSYFDAAEVIGCEVGTVRSRLHRARALLADRLGAIHGVKKTGESGRSVDSTRCFA
jgi:RNA polymerase sigma-70 factor (ECF subfamily)